MLYSIVKYLNTLYDFPGAGLVEFLSFRAMFAVIVALLFTLVVGKKIINYLHRKQVGETVRDLGLDGQKQKEGTPTMGGIIIILGTLLPVLLIAKLDNIYILILLFTTLWMGAIGLLDDYIKIFRKNKAGLQGKFKIIGQVILGVVVGGALYLHPKVTVRKELPASEKVIEATTTQRFGPQEKDLITTIPLLKDNTFNYSDLLPLEATKAFKWAWLIFIPVVIFIITAVSNAANLTDGIDGLAAGSSAIMVFVLGIFAWVSGNVIFADYLNIMYIPNECFYCRFSRSFNRLFMVQHLSGIGIYGRYRKLNHWGFNFSYCSNDSQRIINPCFVWHFRVGKPIGSLTGGVF